MIMFDNDFLALLPEMFLINATILLLMYGVVYSNVQRLFEPLVRNVAWLGVASIIITIILLCSAPLTTANLCYNNLILDNFTFFFKVGLLLSTACTILMCLQYFQQEALTAFESIVLILMSTCSMLFMISAYDLIAMYLAIELQSLCF